jgi:hypothetical protein
MKEYRKYTYRSDRIISYLTKKHGGNAHEKGIVTHFEVASL